MELYKLGASGQLEKFGAGSVRVGDVMISNPPESAVRAAGWKPLAAEPEPIYDIMTEQLVEHYAEGEHEIYVTYTIEPWTEPEAELDELDALLNLIEGVEDA